MMTTAFKTDKYEITMLQSALEDGLAHKHAVFELFARKLPTGRRYGVVAGTARAIEAVKNFSFTDEQIAYLEQDPIIKPSTISYLRNFKFTGTIKGYKEGDIYVPYSPILTVESTFGEAVLLETVLLSIMNHDSAVASAASRMVQAIKGKGIIEMGSRRTHDESAIDASRAAYLTGFTHTSNLEAGLRYGIPTTGTSAHAFSLAHVDEKEAFARQIDALGKSTTLLVDTYDIPQGIRNAVEVAGTELGGIRIDSGDLHEETVNARKLLDSLGAVNAKIVLSSDIDEFTISELQDRGTPFDLVGAGTRVVTGSGHPTAGMVYKLVSIETDGVMRSVAKKASGKKSIGGKKFSYRTVDTNGVFTGEYMSNKMLHDDSLEPVQTVMVDLGEFITMPTLNESRDFHLATMKRLPEEAKLIGAGVAIFEAEML